MSDTRLTDNQRDQILETIQSLGGTIVNIKRYPPGSSIIKIALERGIGHFDNIFAELDSFTLSENERQLLINEELQPDRIQKRGYVSKFIQTMGDRNIKSLTYKKGLNSGELEVFVDILGQQPDELRKIEDINKHLEAKGVTHIEIDTKVFVAIERGQTVADIAELEKLANVPGGKLNDENFKEGVFVQYLVSKLPLEDLNISDEKLELLKQQIDFDKVKNAKNVDFEQLAPVLAAALDRWSNDAEAMEADITAPPPVYQQSAATNEMISAISPELLKQMASMQAAATIEANETSRDERVEKLTNTFESISRVIYSFNQPQIRAKLLDDFLKIVTNFKSFTLARILSTRFNEDLEEKADLKGRILSTLSMKKKSTIIDMFLRKYHRVIEGLNPADFEFNPSQIEESEKILNRLIQDLKTRQQSPDLVEKAQKALGMARAVKKEATDPNKLLILKVRRLITKDPGYFLDDKIQPNIPDLLVRLTDMNRPDVAKKILDKIYQNINDDDPDVRLRLAGAIVRISQNLLEVKNTTYHSHLYNWNLRAFRQEKEPRVYAAFLAVLIGDLGKLIEAGNLQFVMQIFKAVNNLREMESDPVKIKFLTMCEAKILEHEELFDYLIDRFTAEDEKQAEMALKVLFTMDTSRLVGKLIEILRDSEEMRVRKKVITGLERFPESAKPLVREYLEKPDQPWYFIRNLVVLAGDMKDEQAIVLIAKQMTSQHEQVRKACLSSLIKMNNERANQMMAQALPNLDLSSQRMLYTHFGNARSQAGLEYMLQQLDPTLPEKNEPLAIDLIAALGKIGGEEALPVLKKIIRPGKLSSLFGSKVSDKITEATLRALGDLGGEEAKDIVQKFVRNNKPEIARTAQAALKKLS
ncbi:MAG TPA: hypothetical protein PK961_14750 [bacterium]|nr:hypothetical protein [bacterium]